MKKGQAEMLDWFPRLILMMIAVAIIVGLVAYYSNRDVEGGEIHKSTYIARLYYDDIIMQSVNGRTYPGVINLTKFTSENLDKHLSSRSDPDTPAQIAAKLTLTYGDECAAPKAEIYNDEESYHLFESLEPLGGATREDLVIPITTVGDRICRSKLNITVMRQEQ